MYIPDTSVTVRFEDYVVVDVHYVVYEIIKSRCYQKLL